MERRNVIDKRKVKLEEMMRPDYIPFKSGRPERNTVIGNDDMMNLSIALNTSKSFDELLMRL